MRVIIDYYYEKPCYTRRCALIQEVDNQKTNNGIHYRLQLLYANGQLVDVYLCDVTHGQRVYKIIEQVSVAKTIRLLVGGRAFPVASAHIWNRLPDNVPSATSLSTFQIQLKLTLFQQSFPDIIL